jgi:pantoate--beta-alanine ligase
VAIPTDDPAEMRAWADATRATGGTIALVPTMGALHRGHLELIGDASERASHVVVSIFVNPLQFGEANDFQNYPRPIDDDLGLCEAAGVDVVYVPTADAMYPNGFATTVHVSGLTDTMEGASRPGHFDGVTTVVTKLFTAVRPDVAVFGEKDFQQLAIVRRMATDLDLGVDIVGHPTVRETDGLALSSRNRRLGPDQRDAAACLPRALAAGRDAARVDGSTVRDVIDAVTNVVATQTMAALDYVAVVDATSLRPISQFTHTHRRSGEVRLAIAARFGDVRLIDNIDLFDLFERFDR